MPNNNLNVLITRPENEGRKLADTLHTLGLVSYCQPLFDYQTNNNIANNSDNSLIQLLTTLQKPMVIFISVAAVTHANTIHNLSLWPTSQIFAIGTATENALKALNINAISPEIQTSEGLLSIPELQSVNGQDIIIVRGDGGREHLATSLKEKLANVYYIQSYQRIWRQLPSNIAQDWKHNNVNCVVITSDAILQTIVQSVNVSDPYWQQSCYWVVASERIAQHAKRIGLSRIINANGASDNAIANAILSDVIINTE